MRPERSQIRHRLRLAACCDLRAQIDHALLSQLIDVLAPDAAMHTESVAAHQRRR
jgi:hypothetical protein